MLVAIHVPCGCKVNVVRELEEVVWLAMMPPIVKDPNRTADDS